MLSVLVSVAVLSCGNYRYPEGDSGDQPIFTRKAIVGAGVELWLMRCFRRENRDRMLKFRFGA